MNNISLKERANKEKITVLSHITINPILNKPNISKNNDISTKNSRKNTSNKNSNWIEKYLTYKKKKETLNEKSDIDIKMKKNISFSFASNNISKETIFFKKDNRYNLKNRKVFCFILFLLFKCIVPIFSQINIIKENRKFYSYVSEITIKINGIGNQSIISSSYSLYSVYPNEVYINDTKVGENICFVNLSYHETIVRMVWFNKLGTCERMFSGLSNIKEVDLSKFDSSNIVSTYAMFMDCSSLEYINFTNFNTSKVSNMISMFQRCRKLKTLDITCFNTSSVTNMYHIFENCNSLTSLDLSHFNTTLVVDLGNLFYNCYSLTSIDLSNLVTISDFYTDFMFYNCTLKSIDISNFDTSKVRLMNYMFYNCTFLEKLNLSNIDTRNVYDVYYMFYNCKSLKYLNFINEKEYSLHFYDRDFYNVPENIVYCVNETNSFSLSSALKNKKCSVKYCLNDWKNKQKQMYLINNKYECEQSYQISTYVSNQISTTNVNEMTENFDSSYLTDEYIYERTYSISENIINSNFIQDSYINDYSLDDRSDEKTSSLIVNTENNINNSVYYFLNENSNLSNSINSFGTYEKTEIINFCNEHDFYEGKCNDCKINMNYSNENLTNITILKYIYDSFNKVLYYNSFVSHYINKEMNYTITIFNTWFCTNELLKYDYFEINPNVIFNKISHNFSSQIDFIFVYINNNYKNYIEIYNISDINKININSICHDCLEGNNLIIKNNFTNEIYDELGRVIMNKIVENNIDPFNKDEQIFNNICKNFTIETIDIPIKERRQIMFLKIKDKELICNDINCIIEEYYLENLTSVCKCKIYTNFNYLFIQNEINRINVIEYENFIKSKSIIFAYLILKCGKEAFLLENLKINPGFYISVVFLIIQLFLYIFYIIFHSYQKNGEKNIIKQNPPKIQKFEIDDDFEEKEDIDEEKVSNDRKEKDKIKQIETYKKTNLNSIDIENNNEVKIIENKNSKGYINSLKDINADDNLIKLKHDNNNKKITNLETNQECLEANDDKVIHFQIGNQQNNNNNLNPIQLKRKKRSIKNIKPIQKEIIQSEDNLIKPPEIPKEETVKIEKSKTFLEYYWKYLSLYQPIINLFYPNLTIENSYIQTLVKLMKIIFIMFLNIFFNILYLEQKYFRKKYEYFNKKYNIIYEFLNYKITLNERFRYGFRHAIVSGLNSFVICLIIQSIIDYFIFNIKRKLKQINKSNKQNKGKKKKSISNKKINEIGIIDDDKYKNVINNLLEKENKKYIIFFGIIFLIMIFIFYTIITFNEVYRGGISDLIAGTFWTFIFLQIIPFIYCFIFCFIKYKCNKKSN